MNRQEFEHIIKACANATDRHEFLIVADILFSALFLIHLAS